MKSGAMTTLAGKVNESREWACEIQGQSLVRPWGLLKRA